MRWLKRIRTRVRGMLFRGRVEREMEEELRFHIKMRAEENLRRGISQEEAQRDAERRFGNMTRIKEYCRDFKGGGLMETLIKDLQYAARMMNKNRGFALVAIITLALGIGANTAIFSVVNTLLLSSLPFRNADRLVMIWEHNRPRDQHQNVISPANFLDWRDQSQSFESMAAFVDLRYNLTGADAPVEIPAEAATSNFFTTVGVEPILGRGFTDEDAAPTAPDVAVISYGLWQSRFAGDPQIIGQNITLSGMNATVIGVLPAHFQWFIKHGSLTGKPAQLWVPLGFSENSRVRRGRFMSAVGRLRDGVSLEQARAEMTTIAGRLEQQYVDFNTGWGVELVPLREQFVGDIQRPLLILLGAVGFVLLIACANVANLLLARAAGRRREIAIRTALGAGRARIVRQLLTESLLLSILGGALGLLFAWLGVNALIAISPRDLINLEGARLNLPVLGFTLVVSTLTGIVFGLMPALEASRLNTNEALKEGSKSVPGSPRNRRLRSALVVSEIALAIVLLVSAGLLLKSFREMRSVNPGFDSNNLLTMNVVLPRRKYAEEPQRLSFFRQAVERINALPGVRSASAISFLPFTGLAAATSFKIEGQPEPPAGQDPSTDVRVTDENYFRTMNIPITSGRNFTEQEATQARHVIIINEALAREYFPGQNPIGQRITVNMSDSPVPSEIIGVVGDVRHDDLVNVIDPMVYWTHPELSYGAMMLAIRTGGDPLDAVAAVRREIQAIDPDQPLADVSTMDQLLAVSVACSRFSATLLAIFAALALVLAVVGLYSVMSYAVAQRTHELGVRLALGAQPRDVLQLVIKQGMFLTLVGVSIGLAFAFALTRLLSSLLHGVSATDPLTFGAISALLTVVAFLACYIPARRATRIDPMIALRYE